MQEGQSSTLPRHPLQHEGRPGRIAALDVLRGLALAGMIAYHVLWDLYALGLSGLDPVADTPVRWWGHAVAAAFLFVSGLGLRLAEDAGASWRHALKRLAVLALAAGAVTLATWLVVPDAPVRFGILHCLAVTNSIGLLLRGCSNRLLVLAGMCSVALPLFGPALLGPGWAWLGLSRDVPAALDFRPVLPWLAFVLWGLAVGRTAVVPWIGGLKVRSAMARLSAVAGRHSLAIYLVHQPVLLGLLYGAGLVSGLSTSPSGLSSPAEAAAFLAACTRTCDAGESGEALCRATCHCVLTSLIARKPGLSSFRARLDPLSGPREALAVCSKDEPTATRPAS